MSRFAGSPREEIEAQLGEPKLTKATSLGEIAIYGHVPDKGMAPTREAAAASMFSFFVFEPVALMYGLVEPSDRLGVIYNQDDELVHSELYESESTEEALDLLDKVVGNITKICDAPLEEAMRLDEPTRLHRALRCGRFDSRFLHWTCVAAVEGGDFSQYRMGVHYEQRMAERPADREMAFFWFSAAAEAGFSPRTKRLAADRLEELAANMTPDQIEEAKARAAQRQPTLEDCERVAMQVRN